MRAIALLCIPTLLLLACDSNDSASNDESEKTGQEDGGTASASNNEDDDESGSEENSEDDDGSDSADAGLPARGDLVLSEVTLNQGVEIPLVVDGELVPGENRNAHVLFGRDTLLRAYWTIPENWEPREIIGRLHIKYSDGSEKVLMSTAMVEGDSHHGELPRSFWWGLVAEEMTPGMSFYVDAIEADSSRDDIPESSDPPEAFDSFASIGVTDSPQKMKVRLVPIVYKTEGCDTDPREGEENMVDNLEAVADSLFEHNPVQEVEVDIREEAIIWEEKAEAMGDLLMAVGAARTADGDDADDNTYYHGVINICTSGIDGVAGLAAGGFAPAHPDSSNLWISVGAWDVLNMRQTLRTLVHEVGHNQGLLHVECPHQQAAGPDRSYPHRGGTIGSWGFALKSQIFYSPTSCYDYMSYCAPTWVSDWTWRKTFRRIRELTSWDITEEKSEQRPTLYGMRLSNGEEQWWLGDSGPKQSNAEQSSKHRLRLTNGLGENTELDLQVFPTDHEESQILVAPLPDGFQSLVSATHVRPDDSSVNVELPTRLKTTAN